MNIKAQFLDLPYDKNARFENYAHHFIGEGLNNWSQYMADGHFEYKQDENKEDGEIILFFIRYEDGDIALRYDDNMLPRGQHVCWYSCRDKDQMNTFVDANCDLFIPLGSCLPPDIALSVIKDFFINPLVKSDKVEWVDAEELDWSSVY